MLSILEKSLTPVPFKEDICYLHFKACAEWGEGEDPSKDRSQRRSKGRKTTLFSHRVPSISLSQFHSGRGEIGTWVCCCQFIAYPFTSLHRDTIEGKLSKLDLSQKPWAFSLTLKSKPHESRDLTAWFIAVSPASTCLQLAHGQRPINLYWFTQQNTWKALFTKIDIELRFKTWTLSKWFLKSSSVCKCREEDVS